MTAKWEPTAKDLQQMETLAGYGLSNKHIAAVVGVDKITFERRFKDPNDPVTVALEKGKALGAANVTKTLYQMITIDKNVAATIFFCKTRLGWSETPEERSDKNTYKPPVTLVRSA